VSVTEELLAGEETLEDLYEQAPCGQLSARGDGTVVRVNDTFLRWAGLRREEVLGRSFRDLLTSGGRIFHDTHYWPLLHLQGEVRGMALDVVRSSGRSLPVVVDANVKVDQDGDLRLIRITVHDATERRAQEREMARARKAAEASEGHLRVLYRAAAAFAEATGPAGVAAGLALVLDEEVRGGHADVWLRDDDGALVRVTPAASAGALSPASVSAAAPLPVAVACQRQEVVVVEAPEVAHRDFPAVSTPMLEARMLALVAVPLVVQGAVVGVYQLAFRRQRVFGEQELDLHRTLGRQAATALARVRTEEELRHLALHDPLTGASNRALFCDRLERALVSAGRTGQPVAVMFVDLDGFKAVNDTGGHRAGDEVLREVARRLQLAVRPSDTVGRFGGDEFAVLCEGTGPSQAEAVAARLEAEVGRAFVVEGNPVRVTASVGIVVHDPASSTIATAAELIARADGAMYRAKSLGKNGHVVYDPVLDAAGPERLAVERELRAALEEDRVVLQYQPVLDLTAGTVVGVEALCRLALADGHLMAPGEFIGIAEERGLIVPLGRRVMELACAQLAAWDREAGTPVTVAVNVAAEQAARPGFADEVFDVLARTGCRPERLTLELTESLLLAAAPATLAGLERLAAAGIGIVLDDFGTRYASLDYVQRFPLTGLKIDQTFVAHLPAGRAQAAIVRCIAQLAADLDLTCTAEGIENDAQRAFVTELGVRGQGYALARPLDPEDCLDFINGGPRR
jgi:diguanylate cyclase (GGDEF)-like protein/PAS domain S-box-containing protein